MCGIFGAITTQQGQHWNRGVVRALAWANRERGTDSLGFFDSSGKMTKGAGDPYEILAKNRVKHWVNQSQKNSWFIAGHTRLATRGAVNRRNSHPFRYGRIIGSHNGMCDAPRKFQVDSEFIFWSLNKARGDYQKGLGDIDGYWGLSWYDGEHFYLMNHGGELAFDTGDGVLYYSSSLMHLNSCTGGFGTKMADGEVIRISPNGTVARSVNADSGVKAFTSTGSPYSYGYGSYNESSYNGRSGATNYKGAGSLWNNQTDLVDYLKVAKTDSPTAESRDYDHDWQEAWFDYCTESEHTADHERYAG